MVTRRGPNCGPCSTTSIRRPRRRATDLAVRTLRVAALEGMVFTVAALARVQGEDENLLTDWLDDYLAVDGGPLEDLGFVDGKERPLARYGFRDRALWSAMHPDAWPSAPLGRRVPRRYSAALAQVYGHAPEAVFRIGWLADGTSTDEYLRAANAFATEHDHLRLLEAETSGEPGPLSAERVKESLRQVVSTIASDHLLRYARALVELSDVGSTELYDLLGVVASREQWFGDAARCEALALELIEEPMLRRRATRHRALRRAARPHPLAVRRRAAPGARGAGLDAIADDPEELIAAAARTLETAGVAIEAGSAGDREHWRAHLQHAVAQLEAARGDFEAARRGRGARDRAPGRAAAGVLQPARARAARAGRRARGARGRHRRARGGAAGRPVSVGALRPRRGGARAWRRRAGWSSCSATRRPPRRSWPTAS